MVFRRYSPPPPLDGHVDFFWFYERWDGDHEMQQVLPDGTFELVMNLLEEPRKTIDPSNYGRFTLYRGGWWSGAQSRYLLIDTKQGGSMIGAHFKPGGAAAFLGRPAVELCNQVVEFEGIWGKEATALRERMLSIPSVAGKFKLLEKFLLALLRRARRDDRRCARTAWASRELTRAQNAPSVGQVAKELGISHKHFIEEFKNEIGLTPKLFCRIHRFQQVLARISSGHSIPWADLAAQCGYYDQAHFVNDFQGFAGLNPERFLRHEPEDFRFIPVRERR